MGEFGVKVTSANHNRAVINRNVAIEFVNKAFCQEINRMCTSVIQSFLKAIDARDKSTGQHSEQVGYLMVTFGKRLGLSEEDISLAYFSGVVHDIGKIGIPESILNKPTRLTDHEFACIRNHPAIGAEILSGISGFEKIIEVVRYHHERYDGKGYPYGLQGAEIPVLSRMLALCDAYDAMTTLRCYHQPVTPYRAIAEIEQLKGMQFDPELSGAFIDLILESISPQGGDSL